MATESQQSQPDHSSSQDTPFNEQSLDNHLDQEREEIAELDRANEEEPAEEEGEVSENEEETEAASEDSTGEDETDDENDYVPNAKYRVLEEEHEFDPKLKKLLTKETEPIIRELYEKAHGIEAVKRSRDTVTQERDHARQQLNGLNSEVQRVLGYRRAGDIRSFLEAVQLDDNTLAQYLFQKAKIAELPPEQQALYNENEAIRRRMNGMEESHRQSAAASESTAVQARIAELDAVLSTDEFSPLVKAFDARNGAGSFKQAVMGHGHSQWLLTKKDLSPKEATQGFIKMTGIQVPKGRPAPGPNANKRVVARPKVKTLPNMSGSQASVTAVGKPRSIEDLKKIRREKFGS